MTGANDCSKSSLRYTPAQRSRRQLSNPIESALNQTKQITQWQKEFGLLERSP
jgi:hypothetical protein